MKPRGRSPYRLRADGQVKGLTLHRIWAPAFGERVPLWNSRDRSRSLRWIVGTRRHKRHARTAA